ncbi:uncharacterized protein METZ01_LOCUS300023, partial [marine metagenome]
RSIESILSNSIYKTSIYLHKTANRKATQNLEIYY